MKAQRRHALKENDLAHAIEVARDYLDQNGKQITAGVIVVGAVVLAVLFGVRSRGAALEDVWRRRAQLSFEDPQIGRESLDSLSAMTQDVSNERFVFTSLVEQGQQALRLAQQVPDPPDRTLNDRAREAFERLLVRFKDSPLANGLAHSGLTTVEGNEFVLDGDVSHKERAEAHLTAIINDPALNGLPLQRMALDRRRALDATFTRVEFEYPQLPEEPADQAPAEMSAVPQPTGDGAQAEEFSVAPESESEVPISKAYEPDNTTIGAATGDSDSGDTTPNAPDAAGSESIDTP